MNPYKVVDVFTAVPLMGNPVAVVFDAEGLDTARMQAIARWTNLSETTFLLPASTPEADYRLRIFTPGGELPFAGHPTLGSVHAAIEAGLVTPRDGRLVQECGVGLVNLSIAADGAPAFDLPPAKVRALGPEIGPALEAVLGQPLDPAVAPVAVDVGPVWLIAQLMSGDSVLAAKPDFKLCAELERTFGVMGVTIFGPYAPGGGADIEVRSFALSMGLEEDPVCGSGNGCVAVFRDKAGQLPGGGHYIAAQGRAVGRDGRIAVQVNAEGRVRVGGQCVTTVEGAIRL